MPVRADSRNLAFVLDTTVLIKLHRNRCTEDVRRLEQRFECPKTVAAEFAKGRRFPGTLRSEFPWLRVVADTHKTFIQGEGLGPGEEQAILHCLSDGDYRIFVSDDKLARQRALDAGIGTIDSAALVSMIYAKGVTQARAYIQQLRMMLSMRRTGRVKFR